MATIDGSSSSTFPVFVDTNLETHLLTLVSSDDTVDDLKGKIINEHLVTFPNVGEISVKAMKVKRKGFYYSLSNSMVVKKAFEGIKGAWFLHIDLLPLTSLVKSQTGLVNVNMNESDMQPDKHNLVQTRHDANQLAVNREVLEMEKLVHEGNVEVGSDLQQKSKQVTDQEKNDGMDEDHENVSARAGMGVSFAIKKEKYSKRHDALEIDQLQDGTPEHPYVEEKKHKKEMGGSCKELVKKTVMPENNLQEKHDDNLASSEGFSSKPSHVNSSLQASVNSKPNRKKRRILKNDGSPQNEMVDSLLNVTDDATLEKQGAEEIHVNEPVKNHTEMGKESDVADLFWSTQEVLADGMSQHPLVENKTSKEENDGSSKDLGRDLPENSFQEKQETNLVSEGTSLPPPVDTKQKKKRKKHLSITSEAPQIQLVDSSLVTTDGATQGKQVAGVDHAEELVKNHIDLKNGSDAVDLMEESTEKVLQIFLPENCFLEKHGTKLAPSDGIPSKLSDVDSSLQAPVDAKQKKKKKKHLSKSVVAPENDIDNSLDKDNDASLRKQPFEGDHVEELMNNHTKLGKESDAAGPIKESTPKEQDEHSVKLRMPDPLSANCNESTDTQKRSTKFPIEDENLFKASGNNQAQLRKVSDVIMADAHVADKNALESAILSEIGAKSSHRSKRKKRDKTELPNTQSYTHEAVNSPGDEVPEEIQNKISSTHQEQLVGSTVLSSPNEKRKKRSQKKSEKIELRHKESNIQSGTQEEVNSSMDQIIGKLTKEISIKHAEATSLKEAAENSSAVQSIVSSNPDDKSKLSQKKSAENSTEVQFIVPSGPNDKKSKRSRKKSDKVELHSGDPNRAEPVHFLVENPEVCLKDTQCKTHESGPACPSKDSALAVAAVDLTVPPNPSGKKSKRSRKKPEKAELLAEEHSKDEGVHPLEEAATKEIIGNTLNSISIGMDTNSKSATIRREDAGLESLTESTSTINSRNSSRNYYLDHSLANENLEKISGATNKGPDFELTARINPDEIGWSMDGANIIGLEKVGEGSIENVHDRVHNASAEAEDHRQLPKSDSTNIDMKISNPNFNQSEDVQGLPFTTSNSNKEKTKRERKLNFSPQDSTSTLLKTSVSEQHVLKKKPQDSCSQGSLTVGKKGKYPSGKNPSVAGLAASSDTTDDTQLQKKRFRVAVRKDTSKRDKKISDKFNKEKALLSSSATIFNDASSGSSEDEFEISRRRTSVRANLDNPSSSADSDGEIDGTQTAGSKSVYGKVDRRTNDALSSLTKTSNAKRGGKPLSEILKSAGIYKRAKLTASQSEFRDSDSQSFDVVPETQVE